MGSQSLVTNGYSCDLSQDLNLDKPIAALSRQGFGRFTEPPIPKRYQSKYFDVITRNYKGSSTAMYSSIISFMYPVYCTKRFFVHAQKPTGHAGGKRCCRPFRHIVGSLG